MEQRAIKEVVLSVTTVATSCLMFGVSTLALHDQATAAVIVIASLLAIVWSLTMAVALALGQSWWSKAITIAAPTVVLILIGRLDIGVWGGGLLLLASLASAHRALWRDTQNRIMYRTFDLFGSGMRLVVIGLILAIAGQALPVIRDSLEQQRIGVDQRQVEFVLQPLTPILESIVPGVSSETNIDDLIDAQLRQQGIDPNTVPAAQRQEIIRTLEAQLGEGVAGNTSLSTVVAQRINSTITRVTQANPLTVALVIIVLAFLTLRAAVPIVSWVLLLLLAGVMWSLRQAGFVLLTQETQPVQRITL